jgi:hypothetical protein
VGETDLQLDLKTMSVLRPRQQRYVIADTYIVMILHGFGGSAMVPYSPNSPSANGEPFEVLVVNTVFLFALLSNASRDYFKHAIKDSNVPNYKAVDIDTKTWLPVAVTGERGVVQQSWLNIMTDPLCAYWNFRALLHVPGAKLVRRYDLLPLAIDFATLRRAEKVGKCIIDHHMLTGTPVDNHDAREWLSFSEFAVHKDGSDARPPDGSAMARVKASKSKPGPEHFLAFLRHWRQFVGVEGNVAVIHNGGAAQSADVIVLSPGKVVMIQCKNVANALDPDDLETEFRKMGAVWDITQADRDKIWAEFQRERNNKSFSDEYRLHRARFNRRGAACRLRQLLRACCATASIPVDRVVVEFVMISTHAPLSMKEHVVDGHVCKLFTTQAVVGDAAKTLETMERSLLFPFEENSK